MPPPSSLLVFIRKPEITLFSPWHHFLPPVYFCSPQSMQIKSFDLCTFPATDWTLNLILLLRRCACLPRAPALTRGETGPPRPPPARIHYFLHNMRKQHLNETFVSCQNRVASPPSVQIHENGEESGERRRSAPDCNKAAGLVMVAHWNEACWMWVAEQSVSLVTITAL